MKAKRILFCCTLLLSPALQAQEDSAAPLSAEALAECAAQVQTLRSESERLNALAAEHERRRERLEAERRDLHDSESRKRYNEAARAFNEEVADFQRDLDAINALKARYAENCAGRDYRRADLDTLPEAQQKAMRRGLDDITVPYAAPDTGEPEDAAR